ncbi:MAG: DUF4345 family protein [Proteobacteria bacterium]|nr:DUF4345 family protein [Pseudomonadota bacterium]
MQRAPSILVMLSALVYAGIGLFCLVDPVTALDPVGLAPTSDLGMVEARAMYGGLQLGMGAFLIWTLGTPERTRIGLVAATLSIGGLGLARLLSYGLAPTEGIVMPLLFSIELGGAIAGAAALRLTSAS